MHNNLSDTQLYFQPFYTDLVLRMGNVSVKRSCATLLESPSRWKYKYHGLTFKVKPPI